MCGGRQLRLLRGLRTSVRAVFPRLLMQRWEISMSQAVVRPSLRLLRTCKEVCHAVTHTCPLPELLWLLTTGLVSQAAVRPPRQLRVDRFDTDCFLMSSFAAAEKCAESGVDDTATVDRVHLRSAGGLARAMDGALASRPRHFFRTHSFRTQNLQDSVSHLPLRFWQLPRASISGAVDMFEL